MTTVALVKLPKSHRTGIDRRLPRGAKFKDLTGKKFGSRKVLGFAGFRAAFAVWLCRCKCGRLSVVEGGYLRFGTAGSCGCVVRLSPAAKKLKGLHQSILKRCHNSNSKEYQWYGAKGITVCKRWRESAEAFAQDMGPRPSPQHILARRNRRGNYSPRNCYWATKTEAHRGSGRLLTCNGRTLNLAQWAKELGISREALRLRVNRCLELGLDPSEAISSPRKVGRPKKP